MKSASSRIHGSSYIGVFATASDRHLFVGAGVPQAEKELLSEILGVKHIDMRISGSDLVGLFCRANSNGIAISSIAFSEEVGQLKKAHKDINVGVVESDLNAIGSNVLANDRIAIVNVDYSPSAMKQIGDILGVEVIKAKIDGFKTVGANNVLTNIGLVINNRSTDEEKEHFESLTRLSSVRTTANTGSLTVGLASAANSNGVVVGEETTGYELARMLEALEPEAPK